MVKLFSRRRVANTFMTVDLLKTGSIGGIIPETDYCLMTGIF